MNQSQYMSNEDLLISGVKGGMQKEPGLYQSFGNMTCHKYALIKIV